PVMDHSGTSADNDDATEVDICQNYAFSSAKAVVDADGDGKAQSGEVLTYSITVTNTGNIDYNGIVIHDKIPANTTFVDGSATGGAVPNSEGELEWVVDVPFGEIGRASCRERG